MKTFWILFALLIMAVVAMGAAPALELYCNTETYCTTECSIKTQSYGYVGYQELSINGEKVVADCETTCSSDTTCDVW